MIIHHLQLFISVFSSVLIGVHSEYTYRTEYLDVLLDHFSFTDNRTFRLRYLINDTYWAPKNGPIFFYTGNAGDIALYAQNIGFLWEAATKFKALILFAEHRYYGVSLPFGNKSLDGPEYFGYLTSEQVLADFVDVIRYVKVHENKQSNYNFTKERKNPVIAFGGSYGGMLSAWMRMKYPAVIEGTLAASAPIWQFTNMVPCNSLYKGVTSAFISSSQECVNNIWKSWPILDKVASTETGKKWINNNWKLCNPIKTTADLNNLKDWLIHVYVQMAMHNYPYPTNFITPLPRNPVTAMCQYLKNPDLADKKLLMGVFEAINVYFNYTGTAKCLGGSNIHKNGWYIQRCTEMVLPMCADGMMDMFWPIEWNFQSFSDQCYTNYKVRPREFMVEKMYGGKDIRTASNIIFSNGMLDPWRSGGVMNSTTPKITTILIEKAAHFLDLQASNAQDPESVIKARAMYLNVFRKWIKNYFKRRHLYEPLTARDAMHLPIQTEA